MWKVLSYINVYIRTKLAYWGDQGLMCGLLILPESLLFQMQIWHGVLYGYKYISYNKLQNTGRMFWYLYFNMELDGDELIIYDFNRLRMLCLLQPPDADFEVGGKRFIMEGGQLQHQKFEFSGDHLFIKNMNFSIKLGRM